MTPAYRIDARFSHDLRRARIATLAAGGSLLAASIAGAFFSPQDFFHSYLIGYLFWLGLTLGAMGFLMLQYLTGGAWGVMTRRTLEAATRTLPLLAILFVPFVFGLGNLYDWARPEVVQQEGILQHRSAYLNRPFFLGRAGVYLMAWMTIGFLLNRWSAEQDGSPDNDRRKRLARLSAAGLIVYLFTISFASVDWAESLETHWASSIWGFIFIAAEGITALCFAILFLTYLRRREPMSSLLKPDHFHDLGKMLFANLMLWAYFVFVQYLIVWSENLTDEIPYYRTRTGTSWGWLGLCLIVVQFAIPAALLLNRSLKRNPPLLSSVVAAILFMQYIDLVWIVLPSYYKGGFRIQWMDVLTPLGIGGIWLWAFLREFPRFPLLPLNAPDLQEALVHETR